jgi:glycerate kinase
MNFLLAPTAMKGALSAAQIAVVIQRSLRRRYPKAEIVSIPVADGGNGTLECLMNSLGGTVYEKEVTGPIPSGKVRARFGITAHNVGIIESAEAIGLQHITPSPETIAQSTTRGVGELIVELTERNCAEIWIGLGGTATNDGGAGMARALGFDLIDEQNEPLRDGAIPLLHLTRIIGTPPHVGTIGIKLLSDVRNPLLGSTGATQTFARQKGADAEQLPYLEAAMKNFADVVEHHFGKEYRNIPGAGAAGGLGFGSIAFCNASMHSGIDTILDRISFDAAVERCDCVITTEGMIDGQTLFGKGVAGITSRAQRFNRPVHAFVGKINGDPDTLQRELGLASLTQISQEDVPPVQAMRDASWLLADAIYHHTF